MDYLVMLLLKIIKRHGQSFMNIMKDLDLMKENSIQDFLYEKCYSADMLKTIVMLIESDDIFIYTNRGTMGEDKHMGFRTLEISKAAELHIRADNWRSRPKTALLLFQSKTLTK